MGPQLCFWVRVPSACWTFNQAFFVLTGPKPGAAVHNRTTMYGLSWCTMDVRNAMKMFLWAVAAVSNVPIWVRNSPSILPKRVAAFCWCNTSTSCDVTNASPLLAVGRVVRKAPVPCASICNASIVLVVSPAEARRNSQTCFQMNVIDRSFWIINCQQEMCYFVHAIMSAWERSV